MVMKALEKNLKYTFIMLSVAVCTTMVIQRGIHGEYGIGVHGFNLSLLILLPSFIVFLKNRKNSFSTRTIIIHWKTHALVMILSLFLVIYYLSSNGLWCAQHPIVTKALCAKLLDFASFAGPNNVSTWWLTLGDLLAVQRGHKQPLFWEHDIDICIPDELFPNLLHALKINPGHFQPEPVMLTQQHVYLPINLERYGIPNTSKRTGEPVILDILKCPSLVANVTRVPYCDGFMNVPKSNLEKSALLHKFYGDYSVVRYTHHAWMCNLWTG